MKHTWKCPRCGHRKTIDDEELATSGTPYCSKCMGAGDEVEMELQDVPSIRILVVVEGGCCQNILVEGDPSFEYIVKDWDSIKEAGGAQEFLDRFKEIKFQRAFKKAILADVREEAKKQREDE